LARADKRFRDQMQDAYDQGTDLIRDEIRRRAVDGWDEPVFQKGELVGHIRRYDSRLLELEAKKRDPGYRENTRLEVSGRVPVEPVGFQLDQEQMTSVADILALAVGLESPGVLEKLAELGWSPPRGELPAGEIVAEEDEPG